MNYVYRFPVVRGLQAKREYYTAMVPLKMIPKLFPPEEEYVPPEFRAQRKLNKSRIPVISKYILKNRENYVFSALAASIDGDFKFHPSEHPDIGVLEIAMDAKILINDGQHRKAAILDALTEDESLMNETISVVFFEDQGLARSQQMFTDLNKHAVKTSNSIAELYDSRDPLAVSTKEVVSKIKFFNTYTDKEKDNLGKYSSNLFTLNTFYNANKKILSGKAITGNTGAFLLRFWQNVAINITQWNELQKKEISKVDLRENYIVTQAIVIQALGRTGNFFLSHPEYDLEQFLSGLRNVDWRRSADCWQLRVIKANGRMISGETAVILAANEIKNQLGLPLDSNEKTREKKFLRDNRMIKRK